MPAPRLPVLSKFILLSCLLMHLQFICSNWIYSISEGSLPLVLNLTQGLLYLLYPACGWIADKYMLRFKLYKGSIIIYLLTTAVTAISMYFLPLVHFFKPSAIVTFSFFLYGIFAFLSWSMYDANTIQLGMDQMIESSSGQLRSFIYWYQWCAHIGPLAIFYFQVITLQFKSLYYAEWHYLTIHNYRILFIFLSCVSFVFYLFLIFFLFCCKRLYHIEQSSRNPLKIVYQVLKYAYYHKYPERRSAFTYWENYIPSRIDLGKDKYGGPFTYEEVEDVKTMLRLLLLMVCLFGFHISGDGYSLSNYIMNTMGCPSKGSFLFLILNPNHIPLLIVSLAIPIQQLLRKQFPFHFPKMLSLLKVGLVLCLVTESVMCFICALIPVQYTSICDLLSPHIWKPPLSLKCVTCIVLNSTYTCSDSCYSSPHLQYIIYLVIIPFTLKGLSYLFVFVSMFEFICAQSPNSMKGLLIGVWYSMLAIKYCIINVLDHYFQYLEFEAWTLYHGIKGLAIFISIILFFVLSSKYQYRERNEVVNEQRMIEEQYERELLFNSDSSDESLDLTIGIQ